MQSEDHSVGSEKHVARVDQEAAGQPEVAGQARQGCGHQPTEALKRKGNSRAVPGESIDCKRFIRSLQTDNVLTALMFDTDRDSHADYLIWDLACEVYRADQLKQIFDELVQSGLYPLGKLAEELIWSFNRLRDPAPDMDFPAVAAACAAVKQEAKARLAKGDYLWAKPDSDTGRSPDRDGKGWEAMTDALFEKMLSDRIPKALDMRFARDLGL
jgi:hypothetical protein